jgi:hypothetical protein
VPRGARNLRRQWTTAKPRGGDVSCNVLPFFLDLSLAFAPGVDFFDAVKSSVDSEVVFQVSSSKTGVGSKNGRDLPAGVS